MKISKNSWHYRMHKFFNSGCNPSYKSLCTYFWGTVMTALLMFAFLPFAVIFISFLALTPFIYFFTLSPEFHELSIIFGALDIIGLSVLWLWYRDRYGVRRVKEYKEPSLVTEYLKAKKRKVCPLITYE